MSDDPVRTRSPRAPRAETELVSRRTRGLNDNGLDSNLWVIENRLDRRQYAYRWVNNTPRRVTQLHEMDDWDFVEEDEVGFTTERHGNSGLGADLQCQARLMRKPRSLYELHHKQRHDMLLEQEAVMTGGIPQGQVGSGNSYTPNGGNSLVHDKGLGIVESQAPVKRA